MRIVFCGNFQVPFSSESHHAKTLEKLGHTVIRLQEADVPGQVILDWAKTADLYVHIHTHCWDTPGLPLSEVLKELKNLNIPTVTYHLDLWFGLARQKDLEEDDFYKHIGHFFSVDRQMADWFNANTEVKGHYLQAGVLEDEAIMLPPNIEPLNDLVFVGSYGYHPEWPWRHQLIDHLHEKYGERFKQYGNGGLGTLRGLPLNQVYSNTKIAVGDSLCPGFDYVDYTTDRPYETTGRGGFLLMPEIAGLEKQFEYGKEIATFKFQDFDGLDAQIEYYLTHDEEREAIRKAGFERTKNNYTYDKRWTTILTEVGL